MIPEQAAPKTDLPSQPGAAGLAPQSLLKGLPPVPRTPSPLRREPPKASLDDGSSSMSKSPRSSRTFSFAKPRRAPRLPSAAALHARPSLPQVQSPLRSFFHSRESSSQTRYMEMLLSLDKIPRLHNILSSFFAWILLVGFLVFPATFSSPQPGNEQGAGLQNAPLLVIACLLCSAGVVGLATLAARWRRNYVWQINRIYMPGAHFGLAGLISTLIVVYSQAQGSWTASAKAAAALEVTVTVACGAMFVLLNNLLLARVKRQHVEAQSWGTKKSFIGKVGRAAREPPFAPGSLV